MLLSTSEQTFAKQVLGSPQPVLVHFGAPWCGLCRLIKPTLHKFQEEWEGQIQVLEVNADENLKLATTYRLRNLPTLLLFHEGQLIDRLEDFHSKDHLRRTLETVGVSLLPKTA